ncbi:MAG: DUF1161 domain-containing protein [Burkholderiaceae bacterium]|nr:DUF1161 domain-containing protein [Burkholderiaceae bacterium]
MKTALVLSTILLGSAPVIAFAQAAQAAEPAKTDSAAPAAAGRESCDQMKTRISSQIEGHGVKQYTLEIADAASPGDGKVLAHCDGGKKVLVYSKGKADAKPDAGK